MFLLVILPHTLLLAFIFHKRSTAKPCALAFIVVHVPQFAGNVPEKVILISELWDCPVYFVTLISELWDGHIYFVTLISELGKGHFDVLISIMVFLESILL